MQTTERERVLRLVILHRFVALIAWSAINELLAKTYCSPCEDGSIVLSDL